MMKAYGKESNKQYIMTKNILNFERFTNDNIKELRCSLVYFDISFNQLTNVPDTIGLYTNLSTFLANNNYITNINNMCNMKLEKLDTINFGNNKIERLPNKLYKEPLILD